MAHAERTSNIEWCESKTHAYNHSDGIAELTNTISNGAFVALGVFGLFRALRLKEPFGAMVFTELMLIVVGLGSMWFHSTRSYVGEIFGKVSRQQSGRGSIAGLAESLNAPIS